MKVEIKRHKMNQLEKKDESIIKYTLVDREYPKISVVMAVYNCGKYLEESIQSILNQTFRDFEFILVNDCSSDNSLDILKKYLTIDKRIILIINNRNLGPAASRNKGIEIAKGKYISILDADDIAIHNRLEIQYNMLDKNKNIFLLGSGWFVIDESSKLIGKYQNFTDPKNIRDKLPKEDCINNSTVMFRNDKATFYRDKFIYAQDYDLWLRLLTSGKILSNLSEPLIKYRRNFHSITWSKRTKQKLFSIKCKEFYLQRLRYGKDEYDSFDPNEILNLDIENSKDKTVLNSEITSSFKLNNFTRTRIFCKKYFSNYGYYNNILIYYFATLLGKRIVNLIRRIVSSGTLLIHYTHQHK